MNAYPNDDALAEALKTGAPGAEIEFCDRFRPILLKFCGSRVGYDNAEDLAQEALTTGWLKIRSFIPGSDMARWLIGIEDKLILRFFEKARRQRETLERFALLPPHDPQESQRAAALLARVEVHLAVMSNKAYSEAVRLHYFDRLPFDQVALKLGLKSAQVAREYSRRGIQKLKEMEAAVSPVEPSAYDQ